MCSSNEKEKWKEIEGLKERAMQKILRRIQLTSIAASFKRRGKNRTNLWARNRGETGQKKGPAFYLQQSIFQSREKKKKGK